MEPQCAERIEASMNELVKLSDEKLTIATQVAVAALPGNLHVGAAPASFRERGWSFLLRGGGSCQRK